MMDRSSRLFHAVAQSLRTFFDFSPTPVSALQLAADELFRQANGITPWRAFMATTPLATAAWRRPNYAVGVLPGGEGLVLNVLDEGDTPLPLPPANVKLGPQGTFLGYRVALRRPAKAAFI
jgi:hypothetical protein